MMVVFGKKVCCGCNFQNDMLIAFFLVKRPKPFSVFVHNNKQSVQYSSTIIHAGLLKAKETWSHPILDDNKIAKNEEMPFFNILKATPVSNRFLYLIYYQIIM